MSSFDLPASSSQRPCDAVFIALSARDLSLEEIQWSGARWSDANAYGEILLDCAIRHRRSEAALAFLEFGADPFFTSPRLDAQGFRLRARPFEAALERSMSSFVEAVLATLDPSELDRRESQWSQAMSAQLRSGCSARSTAGCSWAHLAAGPDPRCARALRLAGVSAGKLDVAHRSALLSCALNLGSRACAAELLLAGADAFCSDRSGTRAIDRMPESWLGAGAELEGQEISEALSSPIGDSGARSCAWL